MGLSTMSQTPVFLGEIGGTPAYGSTDAPLPDRGRTSALPTIADLQDEATWLEWRSRVPAPAHVTEMRTTEDTRREFLEGARLLRLDRRRRAGDGGMGPSPIQLVIADVLNAGRKFNGILEPRRTTKTTAIQAVILGRCTYREDYMVGWTMAKADGGQKTGERFRKDIVSHVERLYPDRATRPFIVNTGKGTEHIRWPNGSYFNAYAPGNDAFTSGAYDIAWVDEAQDATPEMTEDMLTSIPPTLDGRHQAQMIGSGTAPDYQRGNLLWHLLHMERAGVIRHGIPQDTDPEELTAWEPDEEHPEARVRELIELHHPGIGYTTPLTDVQDNFGAMTRAAFQTEYLGLAGEEGSSTALINAPKWAAAGRPIGESGLQPPKLMALALAVHPDGKWASVAAAWKGKGDRRHVALLHHQEGVHGLGKQLVLLSRRHKRQVVFDGKSSPALVELAPLQAAHPPIQTRALVTGDISRAAVLLLKLLGAGSLTHYQQEPLDGAAEIAVKRKIGESGQFAFGRPDIRTRPDDDITPVEAASLALYALETEQRAGGVPELVFAG